jgi:hypothetical protein
MAVIDSDFPYKIIFILNKYYNLQDIILYSIINVEVSNYFANDKISKLINIKSNILTRLDK